MITCPVCDLEFEDEGWGLGWPEWICPGCFTPGPYPEVEQEVSAGHWELGRCTELLLQEIQDQDMGERDVAQSYALAMRSSEDWNVPRVNGAIVNRWGIEGLEEIKKMAWDGSVFDEA